MMVDTKTGVPLCGDQKDVFLANAAVSWLMEHTTAKTRDDAVEFCRDLANRRVIESVDKGKDFTDSDDKFRFVSTTMEDDTTKTSSIPGYIAVFLFAFFVFTHSVVFENRYFRCSSGRRNTETSKKPDPLLLHSRREVRWHLQVQSCLREDCVLCQRRSDETLL